MTDPVAPTPADHATVTAATTGDVAMPWYKSTAVLGILATMILAVAQKLGYLQEVTSDQMIQLVFYAVTLGTALYGRLTTTKPIITGTAAKADTLNSISAGA